MVGVDEVLDPGHHRRGGEAKAGRAGGVVLDVEHAGEGDAVLGPAAAVGDEVGCLGGAGGGVRVREVVATADEAGVGGAGVLGGERGGGVAGALGGLGGGLVIVVLLCGWWGGGLTLMITKRAPLA